MTKLKNLSKAEMTIAAIIFIAIVLSIYSLFWSHYVKTNFDPFIKILDQLDTAEKEPMEGRRRHHSYNDYHGTGYVYNITKPQALEFSGEITVYTPSDIDFTNGQAFFLSKYNLSLRYWPQDKRYVLGIADLTESVSLSSHSLGSAVDRNGNPLGKHKNDSEEFYREWLALYEKFNEPIMEMFETIHELFGKDLFK
jgi:hypothetical protein